MSDISSDAYFGGDGEEERAVPTLPSPGNASTTRSNDGGGSEAASDSESESDVLEIQNHPQRPQLPSAAAAEGARQPINLQLILCQVCEGSSSFAYCLTARDRSGERHVPRLRVVKGHAHRKRSKAVLLPGQREPPAGAEDGSTEDLVLTTENLALRFRVPCNLCTTLAMCSNKNHPQQERTLADIVGDGGGKGGDERGGENASKEGQGQGRGVKKEAREQQRNGGGAAGRGGGGGGEGGPGREWRVVRSEATTVAPPHKGQPRRKVLEVEGKKVVMPHMVSISDGVVLSLYLAPVSISSEARAGVPGDFAISMDMGSMSRGGYHFGREPVVTIANVLKLRTLRDVISWRYNPTKAIHPIVAAKVLHVWERHHPAEARALDAILRGGKSDKLLRFQADDGPPAVFEASRLRAVYARRSAELTALMASFTEEQLSSTTSPGGECLYEHELGGHAGEGGGGVEGEAEAEAGAGGAGGKVGAGAAGSGVAVAKRSCRRRNSGGGEGHPAATTGTAAAAAAAAAAGKGAAAGSGRRSSSAPSPSSPCSRPSSRPSSPKARRRTQVKEVVASDGRRYSLPHCIREKGLKLHLYVSLRTHRVGGKLLHADPSAEWSPLQKPYGRGDMTRENLLALRAVRDVVYRNATLHPVVAADVFEIWENVHASEPRRADKDVVVVTGALTADGVLPRAKFTAGELRKLRGAERRAVVDGLLESQLKNPKVMAGTLDEVVTPPTPTVAGGRGSKQKTKLKKTRQKSGGGGSGGGIAGTAAGGGPAAVPVHDPPAATAVASSSSASSTPSSSSSPARGGAKAEVRRVSTSKRKKSSSSTSAAASNGGGSAAAAAASGTLERSAKRRPPGGGRGGEGSSGSSSSSARQGNIQDPARATKKGKGRGREGWEEKEEEEEEGDQEKHDLDGGSDDDGGERGGEGEEEEKEAGGRGAGREQMGGEEQGEDGGGGGDGADRFARARRASWLRAVHENDHQLRLEQERLRKEKATAKAAHLARSVELMKWMVDEQSGKHEGSDGPQPRR